ncbi:lipopolysaccharide biosynthesis protein [Empedobacter sedimenti]|uniref:lipopolysaccharide biosynthesis protein n=1 Tax=Empedobacter sedimenti TaxID=3042610 RepID=UPI0024A6A581|nr:polysaccharide biosynthesis C-terminal domain-containing protein [Empedobacter sedimenti]
MKINSIKSQILLYSISTGLNRGAILILMPILLMIFSTSDFGNYNYIQIIFQFFSPLLGLNLATSISREGAINYKFGNYILNKSSNWIFGVVLLLLCLYCMLSSKSLILLGLILGGIEALHNMQLNALRCMDKHIQYFTFSTVKTFGLILIFIIFFYFTSSHNLFDYIYLQIIWVVLIFFVFSFLIKKNGETYFPIKEAILFSIILIPHSVAQWVITGAGRFFIKNLLSAEQLGIFSKVFNLSMILMIFNSGIGIIMPQYLIKEYDKWVEGSYRLKFYTYYSLFSILLFISTLIFIKIDFYYLKIFNLNQNDYLFLFTSNFIGFYLLGFYYYYSNILFALRKNKLLSIITLIISLFSIIVNYFMIRYLNILGASISIIIVYFFYLIVCIYYSIKFEKKIYNNIYKDILLIFITILIIIFVSIIFLIIT